MTKQKVVTIVANPTTFQGYPVELLRGYKGLGPSIIDNDELYKAVVAFNETEVAGSAAGTLGPALLTEDCTVVVTSSKAIKVPDDIGKPAPVPVKEPSDSDEDPWAAHDLADLNALIAQHNVKLEGRVKTPAKLIAALEAAGVKP